MSDHYLNNARGIFFNYEPYRSMSPNEIGARLDLANAMGKMQHWALPGEQTQEIVFTWARPTKERNILKLIGGDCPDYEFWEDYADDARLWIVDMAATPGMSGVRVGRFLSWVLAETGIAGLGEMIIYRRNGGARPGRFGKSIVRG